MFAAMTAVLLVFDAAGLLLLVLGGRVVAVLAVGTFECDDIAHGQRPGSCECLNSELATGIEPVTSSLPRKCSTN